MVKREDLIRPPEYYLELDRLLHNRPIIPVARYAKHEVEGNNPFAVSNGPDLIFAEGGTHIDCSPVAYVDLELEGFDKMLRTIIHDGAIGGITDSDPDADMTRASQNKIFYFIGALSHPPKTKEEINNLQILHSEMKNPEVIQKFRSLDHIVQSSDGQLLDRDSSRYIRDLVGLVGELKTIDAIYAFKGTNNNRFKELVEMVEPFVNNPLRLEAKEFYERVYKPFNLTNAFYKAMAFIDNKKILTQDKDDYRRKEDDLSNFYRNSKSIIGALEKTYEEMPYFFRDEIQTMKLLTSFKERIINYTEKLYDFKNLSLDEQVQVNTELWDILCILKNSVDEGLSARIPSIRGKESFIAELGIYQCSSALRTFWENKGYKLTTPIILDKEEMHVDIRNAYPIHLIRQEHYNNEPTELVPNDIISSKEKNIFVITGPNSGGKTTALRTIGLMQLFAQLGMDLPADYAKISIVENLYVHITKGDSSKDATGEYATELQKFDAMIKKTYYSSYHQQDNFENISPFSLILFDQFAHGTDMEEGINVSKLFLKYCSILGARTYFTTHLHSIADSVSEGKLPGGTNIAIETKKVRDNILPTHKMIYGASEKSYGYMQRKEMGITEDDIYKQLRKGIREGTLDPEYMRFDKKK